MSVYAQRDKSAYSSVALSKASDGKNPYILKWWTPAHDEAIKQSIQQYQWQWYWHIREKICSITPDDVLEAWKHDDPACQKRAGYTS